VILTGQAWLQTLKMYCTKQGEAMSSELLKRIAAGGEFDIVEGLREIARVLTSSEGGKTPVNGGDTAGSGEREADKAPKASTGGKKKQ
jgi:hypothetical protein